MDDFTAAGGQHVLGIDIGGTNFRMGIVDRAYALSRFERYGCRETLGGEGSGVDRLIQVIRDYLDRNADIPVCGIAVGVPGQVSKDHSTVYSIPKVRWIENCELGRLISEATGLPVYVGHDVNFLLMHDIRTMDLDPDGDRTILAFYIGTGFGNALYINGRIHNGSHGVAGELGHVPLYGVTDVCNCGKVGCVETRCCGQCLAELTAREFPDCHIGEVFTKHGDDPRIIRFVKDCALPIATEITILDPDCILMGGGVISMKDFPLELLESEIRARSRVTSPIRILYASESQTNGVLGGCMLFFDAMRQS
ncbi:MAG: allose kinase [Mogibacterium sp.]|nr:allose kinase [Mogibacterium sp.]